MVESGFTMPQNLDMEEAVLGAMLMSSTAAGLGLAALVPGAFYRPSHRWVFQAIRELAEEGTAADEGVVASRLEQIPVGNGGEGPRHALDVVGGRVALMSLTQRVPAVANVRAYIDEVLRCYRLRLLAEAGQETARRAYQGDDPDEVQRDAEEAILGAREAAPGTARCEPGADALVPRFRQSYGAAANDAALAPLSFRRDKMDAELGGMFPGDVIAIGGYTKHGKSFEALDLTEGALIAGHRCGYFTGELTRMDIIRRLVAMDGHSLQKLRAERLPMPLFSDRLKAIEGWPLDVFDGTITLGTIRSECARAAMQGRPYRLLAIDHFHLMKWPGRASERREHQEDGLRELKAIAVEYQLTILVLAQLNENESKQGEPYPIPTNRSWRDTRAIPNICDVGYFVWLDNEGGIYNGDAWIVVTLARNSAARPKIEAPFDKERLRFRPRQQAEPKQQELAPPTPVVQSLMQTFDASQVV